MVSTTKKANRKSFVKKTLIMNIEQYFLGESVDGQYSPLPPESVVINLVIATMKTTFDFNGIVFTDLARP